jgi:nucleotide-binding universal stress UspA family protein
MEDMTMAKRILTPIGEGDRSDAIVPIVGALAHGAGSSVRLVRVFPVPREVVDSNGHVIAYSHQQMERMTADGLDELTRVEAQLQGIPVESVVRFGEPVEEILLEAEAFDADLIALAAPAHGRLRAAVAPGVAERVARQASVPTLTVREAA